MSPLSNVHRVRTTSGESEPGSAAPIRLSPSDWRIRVGLLTVALAALIPMGAAQARAGNLLEAVSRSTTTTCAEIDNGNIALLTPGNSQPIASYVIEARHPKYKFDQDCTKENFDDKDGEWEESLQEEYEFEDPGRFTIFDDGLTVVVAVRYPKWWRPQGMTAVGERDTAPDAHFIVVYKKAGPKKYTEVLVLYQDGNVRLKPLPRVDQPGGDNVFGSSVIVGPAPIADRPFVEVSAVQYLRDSDSLEIIYRSGESANLRFDAVTRESTRVEVKVNYATPPGVALATLRSMYVADDNADVERVAWMGADGQAGDQHVMAFRRAQGSEFLFKRDTASTNHNTSAPDIWIGSFESPTTRQPTMLFLLSGLAVVGILAFCLYPPLRKSVAD